MIPLLYDKTGLIKLGELTNCIECLVEEERNGLFEVSLIYPTNDTLFNSLEEENIIVCNANDTLLNQKFRIYMTRKLMSNKVEVFARHISFDLAYDYINNIDIENQSCEYALNTIFRNSQFSTHYRGYSDIINAQNYKISKVNCIEAIGGTSGSILDTFGTGAEILRDNTNIHVLNKRGHDNGVSIEYSKNLTGFELEEDYSELITRIVPFAAYSDSETNEEVLVEANAVDSDLVSNYSHPYISYMDFSDKFGDEEIPTTSKLTELAKKYFKENECDKPKQNFKIEFVPLSKCVGYEGIQDNISLCDTVTIKDTRFNIDTKAKVIKTVFNVLKNKYESMELGEPRTTLGDIINSSGGSEGSGEQGPPGPQGPPGADGSIGDFPNSLPSVPILSAKVYGFASIELNWTYENKVYYNYELYGSKTKDFTPNTFDLIHAGQTSSYLFQTKPNETWYFRVCAINTHGERTPFSDQVVVTTTKIDDMSNYFEDVAIGNAVVGALSSDYMEAGIIKGHYIDAKNLSVTDGNGKRTLDIDSFGNVSLDVSSLKISSNNVASENYVKDQISNSQVVSVVKVETWFYISNSSTSLTGGKWSTTSPTNISTGKYIWTKTITYFTDNSTTESTPFCIATMGADGRGIREVINYYLVTSKKEGIYTDSSGWATSIQTMTSTKKYLWNYEEVVFTNGDVSTTDPCIIGTYGETGADGKGIVKIYEYYLATNKSEGIYGDTSGWSKTIPTISSTKRFLWNKEEVEYTDGSFSETEPVLIGVYGENGSDGTDGLGIKSVAVQYYLSTSKTKQTGGSWVTTCPAWTSGKYLWIRYYITYTDNTTSYTSPFVDSSWEKVNNLENSVNNVISRVTTAEQKITDSAIVSTVTSSSTYKNNLTGKVDTNKIISTINQTAESIKIQADKIQLEGTVTTGDTNKNYVKIENTNYTIWNNQLAKAFFGFRTMGDSSYDNYVVPKFLLSAYNAYGSSSEAFVITPYQASDNPQGLSGYGYVDLAYRTRVSGSYGNLYSNIKMYGNGDIRLDAVKDFEITSNHTKGALNTGGGENSIFKFSSNSSSYNAYMDIKGKARVAENAHLYLQCGTSSNQTTNEIRCTVYGSTSDYINLRGYNLNAQNGVYAKGTNLSSDRTIKENIEYISMDNEASTFATRENTNSLTMEEMYNFIKDELVLAKYNYIDDKYKKTKVNFIAQDLLYNNENTDSKVGQIIINAEEAVRENNTLTYDIGNYTSVLAGALKVAINEIEKLKEEINKLKGGA